MVSRLLVIVSALAVSTAWAAQPSTAAKASFDRAEKALAGGQLDVAVAAYRDALTASPGYPAALNGLGTALFKQGKRDEAIAQYRAAIEADAQFKLAYFNLGYAARKQGDFAAAAAAYEKYVALDPNDPDGFFGLGESYRQANQPQKAIAAYESYLKKETRPTEQKWVDRAKEHVAALRAAGQPEPAAPPPAATATATSPQPTEEASKPAGLPPGGTAAPAAAAKKVAEGDKLLAEKKYREASFAYQDAVNADPNNVEGLFKLGNSYAVLGYYQQAIDRWTRASQLSSDPAIKKGAEEYIAKAHARMAQAGGGSPQSQGKAPGSGPIAESTRNQARAAYEQGVKQINTRSYSDAVGSLSTAIQLEPTFAVAYVARGSAHIGLRRFAEAAADYQYALKLDPNMASPLYGLAEAYRAMGRAGDARTYYEKYVASRSPDARTDLQSEARQKAERIK